MRTKFTIRPGEDEDLEALGRALAQIQDFEFEIVGYPLKPGREVWENYLIDLRHRLNTANGVFVVAEAKGEIAGVLAGYVEDGGDVMVAPEFDRSAYISDLFVQSEWRCRGIATALIREFERIMHANGLRWMKVCAKSKNLAARKAYEKYGFENYEVILAKEIS